MDKQYYIDKHLKLYDECLIEAGADNSVDVTAGADMLYEDYASAEHIVGYYLHNYGDSALKEWENNLSYSKGRWGKETEQDKEVTKTLKELFPEQAIESNLPKNVIEYSSDIYSAKMKVWCNALVGDFWNPHKQDYITKNELPNSLLNAYENLCEFTGDDYLVEYEGKFYYMIDNVYNERLAGDLNIYNTDELYAVALKNAKTIAKYDELKDTTILVSKSGCIKGDSHFVSILVDPYAPKETVDKINEILSEHMFKLPKKEQEIEEYKYLSTCEDYNILKEAFSPEALDAIEKAICLYEDTDLLVVDETTGELYHREGEYFFEAAIAWFAGLTDTETFILNFGDKKMSLSEQIQSASNRSAESSSNSNTKIKDFEYDL